MAEPGSHQRGDDAATGIGTVAVHALIAAFALVAAPGVAAGVGLALVLRGLRLRWTFAVVLAVGLALPVILAPVSRVARLNAAAAAVLAGSTQLTLEGASVVLWPFWLLIAGATAVIVKHEIERRTRLHGGRAERELSREVGPITLVARTVRRARALRTPNGSPEGVLLGFSRAGEPVRIPPLTTHAMIVGGSGSGKTTTAEVLLEGEVAAGRGFVILDGKGGRSLPTFAADLASLHERSIALWSVLPYGTIELDEHRFAWNPAGGGNPTEIKDRIVAAEDQSEPYYAAIAARGLLAAARGGRQALGREPGLDELASLLDAPSRLSALLQSVDAVRNARDIAWLQGLTEGERSGLRGMGTRLFTMVNSDGGEWLLPHAGGAEVDLYDAVTSGSLVVFSLPEGTYPALIPHVCRYVLAALNAVGTRLEREGREARSIVFVDELSAFDGDQLCGGLERGRSAGLKYIVASQSVSNFKSAGGEKLLDAVLDNSELVLIHRQTAPHAAEQLAGVAGTAEGWEHSHVVSDRYARRFFGDESGERTRRLTEQFRAHPNDIKQLAIGEAVLVRKFPRFAVDHIRVRATSTLRRA